MRKSKHFRKDVIIARIIFTVLCAILIAVVVFVVSLLTKPSSENKDTQNTESQFSENSQKTEDEDSQDVEIESESESESEAGTVVYYVRLTTEVRFRTEPDTGSITIAKLPAGTMTLLLEELDGWYYVEYEGETGYISADYSEIVEQTE